MTKLSPAALQVFWEFNRAASGKPDDWHYLPATAAALRVAADQVVPEEEEPVPDVDSVVDMQIWAAVAQRQRTRRQLLAIAAELEQAADNTTTETP